MPIAAGISIDHECDAGYSFASYTNNLLND
jgi:hypothetical protein